MTFLDEAACNVRDGYRSYTRSTSRTVTKSMKFDWKKPTARYSGAVHRLDVYLNPGSLKTRSDMKALERSMKMLLITTAVLALGASSGAALAHDDPYDWQHQEDHQAHGDYHGDEQQFHALAHRLGIAEDPYEHARLHAQLDAQHEQFHDEHPNTWHDHYRRRPYQGYYGRGYSGGGYNPYGNGYEDSHPYGYSNSYGYSPY